MRFRLVLATLFIFAVTVKGFGQNQEADSQTLRAILAELRAIHEDMRVTETTQLLVAELEMQQAVVNRATESADTARGKLDSVHLDQKQLAADVEHQQDRLDKATNPDERSALSRDIERLKSNIDLLKTAEHEASATLQDMQQRVRDAQDKFASIEAELSAAIARLGPAPK